MAWTRGLMVELPPDSAPELSWWAADGGTGTPLFWSDDDNTTWAYFGSQYPFAPHSDVFSPAWFRNLFRSREAAGLTGVFALAAIEKASTRVVLVGDRLGVQGFHYGTSSSGTWRASTHLLWLLLANGHDGAVDEDAFFRHMAFGYGVAPHRSMYRDVDLVPPGGMVERHEGRCVSYVYWTPPEPMPTRRLTDPSSLVRILGSAMETSACPGGLFLGLTSGKDSLCLAGSAPRNRTLATGTLGVPDCNDRVRAEQLAGILQSHHVTSDVCGLVKFFEWADHVAWHAAGLATASYADMASFVSDCVPHGAAFVMGEGGECVRDFFQAAQQGSANTLLSAYMTPADYLRETLSVAFARRLKNYPLDLLGDVVDASGNLSGAAFASYFYRVNRMPGNFSLRNAVLCTLRPKLSPFLDSDFIDATYSLALSEHAHSGVHRHILLAARPELLPFFDLPAPTAPPTQNWAGRFAAVALVLESRWRPLLMLCDDVLSPSGVASLSHRAAKRPDRSIFHVLRLYSFCLGRALLRGHPRERLAGILSECRTIDAGPPCAA